MPIQTPPDNPSHTYFQPNQMMFLVTHDGDLKEEQLRVLFEQANKTMAGQKVHLAQHKVISFPAASAQDYRPPADKRRTVRASAVPLAVVPRKAFSLVFANVETSIKDFNLLKSMEELDRSLARQSIAGLGLEATTANWLVSGTPSGGIGVGGPGGRPVPYTGDPHNPPYKFQFDLKTTEKRFSTSAGKGVDVAILDTAPCLHQLVEAYHCWQFPTAPAPHPLLEGLLNPKTGRLKVYPAEQADLFALHNFGLEDHSYRMTDHGLFAAGIIHTIAPQADLHLIEVLNPYGVGDLISIANGLQRLTTRDWSRPLVVNCSLMVNIPFDKKHRWYDDPALAGLAKNSAFLQKQGRPLEYICNQLASQGRCVVAAAGNDAHENTDRPPARFPAAFTSVVGVGALPRKAEANGFHAASYSNLADRPQRSGLATLGGEPGEKQGVLGIYIGDFPDGTPLHHPGWAWWAGTSFATPIISGLLAALQSGQPGGPLLQTAQTLFTTAVSSDTTPQGERVVVVTQP